ncbi:MAG: nicotinamide riboside transporter PnuC [Oscillospiraceae bacterium]
MKNPFKNFSKKEWCLWIVSMIVVIVSNVLVKNTSIITLMATLIGVTALIFIAKGDVLGQILTVIFSVLYAITSFKFEYYGEMITYLFMTMPIAIFSIVTWIRHPYKDNEGNNVVEINHLNRKQSIKIVILTAIVTILFYHILKYLDTPNLIFSTISIATSFSASYLMMCRISYYAIAYSCNDIVLIILWILATIEDASYLPMIFCFLIFLINDVYGFISWKSREKHQNELAR